MSVYGVNGQNTSNGSITFAGKVDLSSMPKHETQDNRFIKIFLPKDLTSFYLDKIKAPFIHVSKNIQSFSTIKHLESSVSSTPQIAGGFDGLNQTQCNCTPPDVQVAVGQNYVVEMVNADMGIWDKNGTPVLTVLLGRMYGLPNSDILSDPRIIFDTSSDRWYSSILDVTTSRVGLAVSTTDDPTKSWNLYFIQFDGNCPDQPSIGMSSDKFVVSANDFTSCTVNPSFLGAQYFVIDKNSMASGISNPTMQKFGPDGSAFTIFPVQPLDSASTIFLASAYGTSNTLHLYSISGTVPNVTVNEQDLDIQTISIPPSAMQQNTTIPVDTTDDRIQSGIYTGGNVWLGLNDGCTPQGDSLTRSCVRLIEIDTVKSKVLQDFDIGYNGFYYFYPALTVDASSRLNIGFGYSSSSDYPGLMYAVQDMASGTDNIEKPQVFKQGLWYDSSERYGDYFGAAPDPSNELYAWFAGEYHRSASPYWSTYVATTNPQAIPEFPYSGPVLLMSVFLLVIFARNFKAVKGM